MSLKKLKKYFNTDLVDITSIYDKNLTYSENKRNIKKKTDLLGIRKEKKTFKGSSLYYEDKAIAYQKTRNLRSKEMDLRKQAKKVFDNRLLTKEQYKTWKKHPNKYDIRNVDTKNKPFVINFNNKVKTVKRDVWDEIL